MNVIFKQLGVLSSFLFLVGLFGFVYTFVYQHSHNGGDDHHLIDDSSFPQIATFSTQFKIDTTEVDELLGVYFREILDELELSEEESILRKKNICSGYPNLCSRVLFDGAFGEFSHYEKYKYLAVIIYIVSSIDQNIIKDSIIPLERNINSITLRLENNKIRGKAGKHNIILSLGYVKTMREFSELFVHEAAHVFDLSSLKGSGTIFHKRFTEHGRLSIEPNDPSVEFYQINYWSEDRHQDGVYYLDFASRYSESNTFEYFAEFINMRLFHYLPLLAMGDENDRIKKQILYISEIFDPHFYFDLDYDGYLYLNENLDRRADDSTRFFWNKHEN